MAEIGKRYLDVDAYLKDVDLAESELELEGFLKAGEQPKEVLFAPFGDCRAWIALPKEMIKGVEHLGVRICADPEKGMHEHPYVRLSADPSKEGAAAVISRLLHVFSRSYAARATPSPQSPSLRQFLLAGPPAAQLPRQELRYFGSVTPLRDNCGTGYRCINVGGQCPYGCACVGEDGYGYCSTCCIA